LEVELKIRKTIEAVREQIPKCRMVFKEVNIYSVKGNSKENQNKSLYSFDAGGSVST